MNDFTSAVAGARALQGFICGTSIEGSEPQATQAVSIVAVDITAVSDDRVEVIVMVYGANGATVEALRADGTWASIGSVAMGILNPDVPASYLLDPDHIRLRVAGFPDSDTTFRVRPILTRLSSHKNNDGSLSVSGSTTMQSGLVEAFSDSEWKGIGIVSGGVFSNPAVPSAYLHTADTLRVRICSHDKNICSYALDSTLEFPHPRSVLIQPMQDAAAEQAAMSWRIRKADYQPTGYFALAGQEFEVRVWGNVDNLTLLVGTQGLADRDDPSEQSENMRARPLTRGINIIRDPLGGAIHIRNLIGSRPGVARVIFGSGAIPMPYYVNGITTTQWRKMLLLTKAPEVELVGTHIVVAAFRSTALKFSDVEPSAIVHSHEEVMRLEAEVSGFDGSAPIHTRSRLLIYAVEGSASKIPHATTGCIALPYREAIGEFNEALLGGLAAERWVTLHEYGHHYQTSYNSYGLFGEITVNLYALAVGRHYINEYTYVLPDRWNGTVNWLALPRTEKIYGAPESDPLAMFEQLRKGLGEDFLPDWHRYIREHPGEALGLKYFVLTASIAAKRNLTEFFADWGLLKLTDTDVWIAVNALGFPYPSQRLAAIRPYLNQV
ncbi:peptidase M60 [Pseudomonas syringae]|uniref:M60 family metallopeptidase n=2 Tax=Pseudomonas syringae TaxID=317 RepID=UPI000BB5CA5B|nr:M60 family metallopeptidase [Pseudomonas syringae]PBP68116.1 peptidase M60 [Pseudomonas syringae]